MLSILIVNWNTGALLQKCLASILQFPPSEEYEIIVVDNASSDNSAAIVSEMFPVAQLLRQSKNLGYAAANNIAFASARGDKLLTLNPDTEFCDDSLEKACRILESRDDIGVVAAQLIDAKTGDVQKSIRSFPTPVAILGDIFKLGKSYRMPDFDYYKSQEAKQPMGSFLLFRKAALPSTTPMDNRFPIFFNDVDLLWRIKRSGWKIWYAADVKVIHHGGASTSQVRNQMIWESHNSLIRYYWKWYFRWWSWPFLTLFSVFIWLGALVRARGWNAGFRR